VNADLRDQLVYLIWAFVVGPALGLASTLAVFAYVDESDALSWVLLIGVPAALAVLGGLALGRPGTELVGVTLVTPLFTLLAYGIFVWWIFRDIR
jgi:hypothetical protein